MRPSGRLKQSPDLEWTIVFDDESKIQRCRIESVPHAWNRTPKSKETIEKLCPDFANPITLHHLWKLLFEKLNCSNCKHMAMISLSWKMYRSKRDFNNLVLNSRLAYLDPDHHFQTLANPGKLTRLPWWQIRSCFCYLWHPDEKNNLYRYYEHSFYMIKYLTSTGSVARGPGVKWDMCTPKPKLLI